MLVVTAYGVLAVVLALVGIRNDGFLGLELGWGPSASLPLLLAAAAGTLWRRRAPVVTLAVTGPLCLAEMVGGGQITAYVLMFEALFAPISHGTFRLARIATGLSAGLSAVVVATAAVVTGSVELVFTLLVVVALVVATPLLWGWEVRHHRQARRAAEALARAEHDLALSRSARAVEGERRRIAHDLHDVIAGHLSAVTLHTSLASSLEEAGARDSSLATARDSAKAALRDLQSMITVLSTEAPGTLPQVTLDWESLTARLRGRDPAAQVHIDPEVTDPERVDPSVQAALLRIAAEAVTNAVRHGQAPIILRVQVREATGSDGSSGDEQVRLILENRVGDEDRAEPGNGAGVGLGVDAIGHRAAAVGGSAHAGPVDGAGSRTTAGFRVWRVEAQLPARPSTASAPGPVLFTVPNSDQEAHA